MILINPSSMANPWPFHGAPWIGHGRTMACPWLCHGTATKSMEFEENSMAWPWK